MKTQQRQVAEFVRDVCQLELPDCPTMPDVDTLGLCWELIKEEATEVQQATVILYAHRRQDDFLHLAKELADLLYVTLYTCNACGIDIEPVFQAVHESNMTKKGGTKRPDGKLNKPDTYIEPDLYPIIERQMHYGTLNS